MWQFIKQKINKKLPFKDNASDRIPLKPKPLTEVILKYEDGFSKNYEDFLKYGLEEKSIQNIGVMGDYGVGKSSILKSFFYHNEEFSNKYLRVQLGKYFWENEEESKGNNRKNLNDHLEEQIIKQIVSQINSKDIPYSKFNIKFFDIKSVLNFLIPASVISFLSWVLDGLSKGSFSININTSYMSGIIILFILICTIWLLLKPITYILNFLAKFTFEYKFKNASVNVELNNFFKIDENIKEIVYLFSSTEKSIIIFEDLDRFDNTWIFQKLKELNTILNYYLEANQFKKKKNKKITFIYLIRDNLLIEKDNINLKVKQDNRVKIFDLCIPIIPKISKHNSFNYLQTIFIKTEEKSQEQKKKFQLILNAFSWHLSDIREIHNIYNQYIVYKESMKNYWFFNESELLSYLFLKNKFIFQMQGLINTPPSHENKIYNSIINSEYIFSKNLIVHKDSEINTQFIDDTFFICYFYKNIDSNTQYDLNYYIRALKLNKILDCLKEQENRNNWFFNPSNEFEQIIHLFIKKQIITPNFFHYGSLCYSYNNSSNDFNQNLSSPNFLKVILKFFNQLWIRGELNKIKWNFKNFWLDEEINSPGNIEILQIQHKAKGWNNEKTKILFVSKVLESLSENHKFFEDFWTNFMLNEINIYDDYKILKNIFWVVNTNTKLKLLNKIVNDLPLKHKGLNIFFQSFSPDELKFFFGIILILNNEESVNWSNFYILKPSIKKHLKNFHLQEIFEKNKYTIQQNKNLENFFKILLEI